MKKKYTNKGIASMENNRQDAPQHCIFMYRRSGFNCEILLNANCEFFKSSQLIDSQE